ncbi:MAG: MFS transporter [Candidatus Peribacteraceae bacterium]|nr:MFS transporter [Candidatus Peribacteraceae bacterium]
MVPQSDAATSRRTVRIFSIASFLHDLGSNMIFSVWPLFLTNVLGANMQVVGLIDGLGDAIVSISQAVSGYVSDRIRKRKIFVWTGYLLAGIAKIGYAVASSWQFVLPFRMLDRSGKMRGAPRDAIISDLSTARDRGRNFGMLRMMDNGGAVVGIILAILFIERLGYRTLFMLAAIPSVCAAVIILFCIKEEKANGIRLFHGVRLKDYDRSLLLYFLLNGLFSIGAFSYSFLMIFAQRSGVSIAAIPVLYLLFTAIAASVSLPFGKLSDRIGRKVVLYISFACWAAVLGFLLLSQSPLAIGTAFIFYGLHQGALDPVQKTLAAELAPKQYVASILGSFQMVIGLLSLPASLIAGVLWETFGMTVPFAFSLVLTVAAAALLLVVREPAEEAAERVTEK